LTTWKKIFEMGKKLREFLNDGFGVVSQLTKVKL